MISSREQANIKNVTLSMQRRRGAEIAEKTKQKEFFSLCVLCVSAISALKAVKLYSARTHLTATHQFHKVPSSSRATGRYAGS